MSIHDEGYSRNASWALVWISSILCSLQRKTWPASAPNEFGLKLAVGDPPQVVGDPPQAVSDPPQEKQVSNPKTIIFNFAFIHKSTSQVFTYVAYKKKLNRQVLVGIIQKVTTDTLDITDGPHWSWM
jgi:hypothetical protein